MPIQFPIAVMKSVWKRDKAEEWAIHDIKELMLSGDDNRGQRYFLLRGDIEMLTRRPSGFSDVMSLFGSVDYLIQQSIVPVETWISGDNQIKCIGTASIISCSGYVITAAHVILDPLEAGYGAVRVNKQVKYRDDLNFGVLIPYWAPWRGIYSRKAYRFFPFVHMRAWGNWIESPLIHEGDRWEHLTDVAVCKIPEMPDGQAHQPLNLSLNPFEIGEDAYALGYAEMPNIEIDPKTGNLVDDEFRLQTYVTAGNILHTFPQNHIEREVSTPGPCFDFDARVPGKMSGAPVFGGRGIVVRGVVSRSFSGEEHAYGSMLSPVMDLPLFPPEIGNSSLRSLLDGGSEGMARLVGAGL